MYGLSGQWLHHRRSRFTRPCRAAHDGSIEHCEQRGPQTEYREPVAEPDVQALARVERDVADLDDGGQLGEFPGGGVDQGGALDGVFRLGLRLVEVDQNLRVANLAVAIDDR